MTFSLGNRFGPLLGTVALFSGALLMRCSSSDADDRSGEPAPGTPDATDDESKLALLDSGADPSGNQAAAERRCSVVTCTPSDASTCSDFAQDEPSFAMGGYGGMPGSFGGATYGGMGGQAWTEREATCQVSLDPECADGQCSTQNQCSWAGSFAEGDECNASSDCGPEMACVEEGDTNRCRSFCCEGTDATCDSDAWCKDAVLTEFPTARVPVCTPLDRCKLRALSDARPDAECSGDESCIVVRSDGATSCAPSGGKLEGETCTGTTAGECAEGYVCAPAIGCVQICDIAIGSEDCTDGKECLTHAGFPEGIGVCHSLN